MLQLTSWLPTTKKEVEMRGWDMLDIIIFSGDAYVDHPSFGAAVIGREWESMGLRVAIVPQPDWHGDYRDFRKLGRPRMFFAVAPGAMDSMVNKYTAARRLRSEDAYSPDGRHDKRPEYPTIVYTRILKQLWPDAPVVLGGIEASLRRVTHYDYWKNQLMPSILVPSGADLITYGMGEKPNEALVTLIEGKLLHRDEDMVSAQELRQLLQRYPVAQTVTLEDKATIPHGIMPTDIILNSHDDCLKDRKKYAVNFRHIEEESNRLHPQRILQQVGERWVVVNPPFPPMTTKEIDHSFDLPYTRLPHPKYRGHRIPAYEMIRHSVTIHRGCFGGCAFCTISAHQGKFIMSRSKESILKEVEQVTQMPDFKGYISDLGGPSANMYMMGGKDRKLCGVCKRPSCIHPNICRNLHTDHQPLIDLYRAVDAIKGVKKSFIGSGVRYDLLLNNPQPHGNAGLPSSSHSAHNHANSAGSNNIPAMTNGHGAPLFRDAAAREYAEELIRNHVSGRLKVAPEHTEDHVLNLMRKPTFDLFYRFKDFFDHINRRFNLRQQIIPYFISSHPGCSEQDMARLAQKTRSLHLLTDQVQDFTPTPMTLSTDIFYSGYHPYTLQPVFTEHDPQKKQRQRSYFVSDHHGHDNASPTRSPRSSEKSRKPYTKNKPTPKPNPNKRKH